MSDTPEVEADRQLVRDLFGPNPDNQIAVLSIDPTETQEDK